MADWRLYKELPLIAYPAFALSYIFGNSALLYSLPLIPDEGRLYFALFFLFWPLCLVFSYIFRCQWKRLFGAMVILGVCTLGVVTQWGGLLPESGVISETVVVGMLLILAEAFLLWELIHILRFGVIRFDQARLGSAGLVYLFLPSQRPISRERDPIRYWICVALFVTAVLFMLWPLSLFIMRTL